MRGVNVTLRWGAKLPEVGGPNRQEIVADSTLGFTPEANGDALVLFADDDGSATLLVDGPNETAVPYLRALSRAAGYLADGLAAERHEPGEPDEGVRYCTACHEEWPCVDGKVERIKRFRAGGAS